MSNIDSLPSSQTRMSLKDRFNLNRFFKGEKATVSPIVLTHRRIFILPTMAGLFCGLILAIMLLASIIYNNNPGFLLTFLLASICLVSILHNFRSLSGLCVRPGRSEPVFAGESASYAILIENRSTSARLNLSVSITAQRPVLNCVSAQSTVTLKLPLKTVRRGWFRPDTITISSRFPLGLFRAWSPLNFSHPILVYPKPAEKSLPQPNSRANHGSAQNRLQDGEDFFGLQEYQSGDSLHHIHWKAYAKGHGLVTKQYGGQPVPETLFDLDQTPGVTLEERISQLCRSIIDAERSGVQYGMKIAGYLKKPDRGEKHQAECLKALALH